MKSIIIRSICREAESRELASAPTNIDLKLLHENNEVSLEPVEKLQLLQCKVLILITDNELASVRTSLFTMHIEID